MDHFANDIVSVICFGDYENEREILKMILQ